jgi:formylglycine-generating enzyme required for sulfatase activity
MSDNWEGSHVSKSFHPVREYITPEIISDLPVHGEPSGFHFDDYAKTLARLISSRTTQTPLTIAISGSWGSGKTTLLSRLQDQLDKTVGLSMDNPGKVGIPDFINPTEKPNELFRACRTVWFNAWKYADEQELLVALVRVIVQRMWEDDFITKNLTALFEPFTPRRDVINTVLGWFSIKLPFFEVEPGTGAPVPTEFGQKTAMLDRFNEVLDRLLAAWVHQSLDPKVRRINPEKGVLVVFIDDLDRCLPAKTVQVLEAVKLFLDRPGCVFVIGADTALTAEAVQSYYDNAKVTGQKATDYLEKIVQLRFDLPPIAPKAMQSFLSGQRVEGEMLAEWETLIAAAEVNPRRVKAVFNDINLQWSMLVNSGQAGAVQRPAFMRWNAIWRAAPPQERLRIQDLDDVGLRFSYLRDALAYARGGGEESVRRQFQAYEGRDYLRLRAVLRKIGELDFDAEALDAFIHLTALPGNVEKVDRDGERSQITLEEIRVLDNTRDLSSTIVLGDIEFIQVPSGPFRIGSLIDDETSTDYERPQHTLSLDYNFWIAKYPITNALFARFLAVGQGDFEGAVIDEGFNNHPVMNISWQTAMSYCGWLTHLFGSELPAGMIFTLPSEAEWEKAARGVYGNMYPWGNEFDPKLCNTKESNNKETTPVGKYSPQGDSPYGVADMAGNVWEWTRSICKPYPYVPEDGRELTDNTTSRRVRRGGSFYYDGLFARCSYRLVYDLDLFKSLAGFRPVLLLKSSL